MHPFTQSAQDVIRELKSSAETGLSTQEANKRLQEFGPNRLPDKPRESFIILFLKQFQSSLIYVLLAAVLLEILLQKFFDALIIGLLLVINAFIGAIQEGRASQILESLKRFLKTDSLVLRDGKKKIIADYKLVPGDIIILQEGTKVAADARLLESYNLTIDEAVLTGESTGVLKDATAIISKEDTPVHDQVNMVFTGTHVLSGNGKAIVTATGSYTEIGKLHKTVEHISTEMPLIKDTERLSNWLIRIVLVIALFFFFIGLLHNKEWHELVLTIIALCVSAVPEGLPIVTTIALATAAYRMALRNVLIKKLPAIEALGRIQVLVVDKTGTLTRNELIVSQVYADNSFYHVSGQGYSPEGTVTIDSTPITNPDPNSDLWFLALAGALLNRSERIYEESKQRFRIQGEPTQAAMAIFAEKLGITPQVLVQYKLLYEIPFDPVRRLNAGFFKTDNQILVLVTGSPEMVLERCNKINSKIESAFNTMLDQGLRMIGASKTTYAIDEFTSKQNNNLDFFLDKLVNMQFLGFFGMEDTIREGIKKVVHTIQRSGIHLAMATGDHLKTALFVAKKLDIFRPGDIALTGFTLDDITPSEFLQQLLKVTVFARVTPQEKLEIVKGYHMLGYTVGMTGDGVNDVPPLVAADVGIAMGIMGTEVTKEAADIVLLDDSLHSISAGIEEGRAILLTLRRIMLYLFATNLGELLVIGSALTINLPLPLLASQILWINLVTDGFLDVTLALEPTDVAIVHKPSFTRLQLFDFSLVKKLIVMAITMAIGSFALFSYYQTIDLDLARTITLITMALYQWFNAWNMRSEFKSLFKLNPFSNLWLIGATILVFVLQLIAVYTPIMQKLLHTVPLSFNQWLLALSTASTIIFVEEIRKKTQTSM